MSTKSLPGRLFQLSLLAGALAAAVLPLASEAGATIPFGDGESVSLGLAMRGSFASTTDAAPNGTDRSANFSLESVRLLLSASLNPYISGTLNTERNGDGTTRVLEAFASFTLDPAFNIWAGRILPPSDRANMDGPYYAAAFDYPGLVSNYYSIEAGRDDGVTAWGVVADKKLVYSAGVFQGRNHSAGVASNTSNQKANVLFAGRLAVNFLSPEPAPAYLEGSTYFGGAGNIFTVGLAGMSQSDGVGSTTAHSDYKVYNLDFLYELPIDGGSALDVSGAYYKYDYSVAAFAADVSGGAGIVKPGKADLLEAEYLFGPKVGVGRFQPFARYQKYDYDSGGSAKLSDVGVNYIIKGADAKLSAFYIHDDESNTGTPSSNTIKVAFQLQF